MEVTTQIESMRLSVVSHVMEALANLSKHSLNATQAHECIASALNEAAQLDELINGNTSPTEDAPLESEALFLNHDARRKYSDAQAKLSMLAGMSKSRTAGV